MAKDVCLLADCVHGEWALCSHCRAVRSSCFVASLNTNDQVTAAEARCEEMCRAPCGCVLPSAFGFHAWFDGCDA